MTKDYDDRIAASVEYIMGKIRSSPKIAVILGSGLGNFGEMLADKNIHRYKRHPALSRFLG